MSKKNVTEFRMTGLPKPDPMVRALDLVEKVQEDFKMAYAEGKAMSNARTKLQARVDHLEALIYDAVKIEFLTESLKQVAQEIKARDPKREVRHDNASESAPELRADATEMAH